ncbi:MAG TPA: glycosyltransferase family 4 protein [Kiritimatiellia bacterium]|nr:glycosyltransferase family 4 protein [Kiritimatiellia bacterium]
MKVGFINNPQSSSGLGPHIAQALSGKGCDPVWIHPLGSRWRKLLPVLRSLRWNRDAMWKARWEEMVFSSRAWDRTSIYVGARIDALDLGDAPIFMVGKEYFPHPNFRDMNVHVFIHHNMRLALADGVTPWLPPRFDIPRYLERETALYQHARTVFVGAGYVRDSLVHDYGVAADRVVVAGGGPHPFFEQHRIASEDIPERFTGQLLFVGWDFGMKGGKDVLAAFQQIHDQRPDLRLVIAGPDRSQWREQAGVTWLGAVASKEELLRLYRQSDLLLMPSLRDSFGFVFLEAMSQGVPCLGSNINAMPEIIQHGRTGYTVPLRNPPALAETVLAYYHDERNRRRMGIAARDRVISTYTWDRVAGLVVSRLHC